jgi:hypothetical protein
MNKAFPRLLSLVKFSRLAAILLLGFVLADEVGKANSRSMIPDAF